MPLLLHMSAHETVCIITIISRHSHIFTYIYHDKIVYSDHEPWHFSFYSMLFFLWKKKCLTNFLILKGIEIYQIFDLYDHHTYLPRIFYSFELILNLRKMRRRASRLDHTQFAMNRSDVYLTKNVWFRILFILSEWCIY